MKCKVGDLAFVLAGQAYPENVGRIVRVVGPARQKDFEWIVQSEGAPLMTTQGLWMSACCYDDVLSPIRPAPDLLPAPPVEVINES